MNLQRRKVFYQFIAYYNYYDAILFLFLKLCYITNANVFSYLKMFAPWLYYFHNNFGKTILSHPLINIQLQQMIVYVKTVKTWLYRVFFVEEVNQT